MNDIQRIKRLAGILNESVESVPGIGKSTGTLSESTELDIEHAMARFNQLLDSSVDQEEALAIVGRELEDQGFTPDEVSQIMSSINADLEPADPEFDDYMNGEDDLDYDDNMDGDFDSAMASAGFGSDEDYGSADEVFEGKPEVIKPDEINAMMGLDRNQAAQRALELLQASNTTDNKKDYLANQINKATSTMAIIKLLYQMVLSGEGMGVIDSNYSRRFGGRMEEGDMANGYNDVKYANGNDYFPDGADSPVVDATGPSGGRQGDNPEQKSMKTVKETAEIHKDLVYGYRAFLKENASPQKKRLVESAPSNFSVEEVVYGGTDPSTDYITFSGGVLARATVSTIDGQMVGVEYAAHIEAGAEVFWESDEAPTGWNYATDDATYSRFEYAVPDDLEIESVEFEDTAPIKVGDDEMTVSEFENLVGHQTAKALLNPALFKDFIDKKIEDAAESLEPPEPEPPEPYDDY
jgi:hypothetical protein